MLSHHRQRRKIPRTSGESHFIGSCDKFKGKEEVPEGTDLNFIFLLPFIPITEPFSGVDFFMESPRVPDVIRTGSLML